MLDTTKKVYSFAIEAHRYVVDEGTRTLTKNGEIIFPRFKGKRSFVPHWRPASFDLLCRLIRNRQLAADVELYAPISRLRRLLGDTDHTHIDNTDKHYFWRVTTETIDVDATEKPPGPPEESAPPQLLSQIPVTSTKDTDAAVREIAALANRSCTPRQREVVSAAIADCLEFVRLVHDGQIRIAGREDRYFERFFACIEVSPEPEFIRAFIRLAAFEPDKLANRSWFHHVYERLAKEVKNNRVVIEYIFLLRTDELSQEERAFIARYEEFATKISVISEQDRRLVPGTLRPSIILFERQKIAFTHDRGEDSTLIDIVEWGFPDDFHRLRQRYERIEFFSKCVFSQAEQTESGAGR